MIVKPAFKNIQSFSPVEGSKELIFDSTTYESLPVSITNPTLSDGESAAGTFTAYATRIDVSYKFDTSFADVDCYALCIAVPEGGTFDDMVVIFSVWTTTDWTSTGQNLTPGNWIFYFGVFKAIDHYIDIQGWIDNIHIQPSLKMSLIEDIIPRVVEIPNGELVLTAETPGWGSSALIPAETLLISAIIPSSGPVNAQIPVAPLVLSIRNPSGIWALQPDRIATAKTVYSCVLTGAPDGLSDLTLPMSSFQARMRDGDPSYLSVVVPSSVTYAADIAARSNGEIVISKGYKFTDDTEQMEEIIRSSYDSIQVNRGARSDSLTMTGYKTTSSSAPKERTLDGVSYYGLQADGKRRVRADLDLFLRVGDTAIYGDGATDYFIVGTISYFVGAEPLQMIMEAGEA